MVTRPILSALQVAQDANAAAYRRSVQGGAPGECWDYLILTATNAKQAEGYRQELAHRQRPVGPAGAFFPAVQKVVVVPDPPGPRIGSGGATLNALRHLVTDHGVIPERLPDLRILLIHSGGLSQRLPAYSPLGKIFSPLPLLRPDGQVATLFDHLYVTLAGLPERLGPGTLVLSGDVFLLFDHRHVSHPADGVTALTFRVAPDVAMAHGVFVTDAQQAIRKTLQKVSPQQMRVEGAADAQGRVLIDTGLLFFDPACTKKLASLAGLPMKPKAKLRAPLHEVHGAAMDLYVDVVTALSTSARSADFATPMGKELHASLRGMDFGAMVLEGEFLHLGTTQQFRDAMTGRSTSPVAGLLQQNVLLHSDAALPADCRAFHAALVEPKAGHVLIGSGSLVESSVLPAASKVGANCVVSQVATTRPLELSDGLLFFQVPLLVGRQSLYAQVLCGVTDDFKGRVSTGECRFLNAPLQRWLDLHGISAEDVWPRGLDVGERTLWNAWLFPATTDRSATDAVAWFESLTAVPAKLRNRWRKSARHSMAMILEHADPAAMIEHREAVTALVQTGYLLDSIRAGADTSIDQVMPHYATAAAYRLAADRLASLASSAPADATPADALHQARAAWGVSQLSRRPNHPDPDVARSQAEPFAAMAFSKIVEASERASRETGVATSESAPVVALKAGRTITATSPARLDLSGGWSDTPPYCYERGGHVINVAVDLAGRSPIVATVRTLAEPKIVLDSRDLGRTAELKRIDATVDVRDPFALHKVALQLVGLAPMPKGSRVGLEITTECRLPKGSGLGTSSILAATLLAALNRLTGRRTSPSQLFDQTLLLEQRLSTGGGWQDQVGGIVGGIKSTVTAPGLPQRPDIEVLDLSDELLEAFEDRLVVYYSGQQRLARDILRRVMGRWLSREPAMTILMDRLKRSAADLRAALLKGRWAKVAEEIDRYWRIKKELYPGSTTPSVDVMLLELREHYAAAGLAGAGGGGFGYFFCKDARQAKRLTELLEERASRPGSLGAVYPARINRRGLVVKST